MMEEITQKHLERTRVRGAPSTIPGASGLVRAYPYDEQTRQTVRALTLTLDNDFSIAQLQSAQATLAQYAAKQGLRVLEQPMFALSNDPMEDIPSEWEWTLLQPVRGPAKKDEEAGLSVGRIQGGAYLSSTTAKGFPDLRNLYTFFLGEFLPSRKQQLTRPLIYHRVLSGLESGDPAKLTLEVFIPIQLTLSRPVRLVTREEMG